MNNNLDRIPWIEKYRPRKIDDLYLDKTILDSFVNEVISLLPPVTE